MRYEIYGPFDLPVEKRKGGGKHLAFTTKKVMVEKLESASAGLAGASGCYVFSIRAGRGYKPWYVGKTSAKSGFAGECFGSYQMRHYDIALSQVMKGTPVLHLVARVTASGRFAKPDVQETKFLEQFTIGLALNKNVGLRNKASTRYYRDLIVPGIVNSDGPGKYSEARHSLRTSLGLARPRRKNR
jgi:hypothetical protein